MPVGADIQTVRKETERGSRTESIVHLGVDVDSIVSVTSDGRLYSRSTTKDVSTASQSVSQPSHKISQRCEQDL